LKHIAFIMDGNGRWARRRGLPRYFGHKVGYDKMKAVTKRCSELGLEVCSIYAFSTENWSRPQEEIDELFRLIRENMHKDTPLFMEWNIRVVTMGDVTRFPKDLQDKLAEIVETTKNNTGCVLNLCINYGGRADIIHAVNKIRETDERFLSGAKGSYRGRADITEQEFDKLLYGADLPPPDLIVRTSGEQRVSNFMLWQMAYSEFLFIKPYWPQMTAKQVDKCVAAFKKRKRRFGKIG